MDFTRATVPEYCVSCLCVCFSTLWDPMEMLTMQGTRVHSLTVHAKQATSVTDFT